MLSLEDIAVLLDVLKNEFVVFFLLSSVKPKLSLDDLRFNVPMDFPFAVTTRFP